MHLFDLLTEYLSEINVGEDEVIDFPSISKSPKTPVADKIEMGTFNAELLREIILSNIAAQGFRLRAKTWKKIHEYLGRDFRGDATSDQIVRNHQIFLQVLVHISKIDVKVAFEAYQADESPTSSEDESASGNMAASSHKPPSSQRKSIEEFYDLTLLEYTERAMRDLREGEKILVATEQTTRDLKRTLTMPPILSALSVCLNDVLTTFDDREFSDDWIRDQINRMNVYTVTVFAPYVILAGAVLLDGILICVGSLGGPVVGNPAVLVGTDVFDANLVTLASHECGHFLDRCKFADFNFSSPFKYLPNKVEKRFDLVNRTDSLEIGRNVELLLFDGIQPMWRKKNELAAIEFLNRLNKKATYPVITKDEHKKLRLRRRSRPSTASGIDIAEEDVETSLFF